MSNKKLTILGVIAAVMLALAIIQSTLSKHRTHQAAGKSPLIQGLNTDEIDRIVIQAGEDTVTLQRQGEGFVVTNLANYKSILQKINHLVISCMDIQTLERITSNPENHDQLEVSEQKANPLIRFFDKNNNPITGIAIGKRLDQGAGKYVRRLDRDDVYVAENAPWLQTKPTDYVNKTLFRLDKDKVIKVEVTAGDEKYTIISDPNAQATLENLPAGKKAKTSECNAVLSALSYLDFDGVQKQSPQIQDLTFNHTLVYRTKDSTVYTLKLAEKDDKFYLMCAAEFTDTTPVLKERKVESEEELQKKDEKLQAQQKAQEFIDTHTGWVYEISSWQGKKFTKTVTDLTEDIVTEKPAEPASAPTSETPEPPTVPAPEATAESPVTPAETPIPAEETTDD